MSDIQKRIDGFFDSMDRDELISLLQKAGFTVSDGDGCVLFTEEESYSCELTTEKILRLADELGIEYELNSKTPGFFIETEDGEKEVTIEEIFLID